MKTVLRWIAFPVVLFIGWTIPQLLSALVANSAAIWLAVILHLFLGGASGVGGFAAVTVAPKRKIGGALALILFGLNEWGSFHSPDAATWPKKMMLCRAIVDFFLAVGIVQATFIKNEDLIETR